MGENDISANQILEGMVEAEAGALSDVMNKRISEAIQFGMSIHRIESLLGAYHFQLTLTTSSAELKQDYAKQMQGIREVVGDFLSEVRKYLGVTVAEEAKERISAQLAELEKAALHYIKG